jgi:hypothetical protein
MLAVNGYTSRDHMGSEYEMGDFLYGLVRMGKPELVAETGCYFGDTSLKIAQALLHNAKGELVTCDPDIDKANFVTGMLKCFPVRVVCCASKDMGAVELAGILFSDSGNDPDDIHLRFEEYERAKQGCLWVVHDAILYPEIGQFVRDHGGTVFPYSRGFGLVLKP